MTLNNIDIIKPLLKRENENEFYYIQIIQRKKDIEGFTGNNRPIKDYYIFSMEQLDRRYEEIKNLCIVFNARAYIRLSRRNTEDIARDMIVSIGEAFRNKSYSHLRKIYSTVVGQSFGLDKIWIIDIDSGVGSQIGQSFIDLLTSIEPIGEKILGLIPTKNGLHVLTKPFNLKKRKDIDVNKSLDVHKNNPTVLFIP